MSKHVEVLERLARLRETGALTEAEFQEQKAALLRPGSAEDEHWFSKAWQETRSMRRIFQVVGVAMLIFVAGAGAYWWSRAESLPETQEMEVAAAGVTGTLPEIEKGTPFAEARRELAKAGFEPAPIFLGSNCPGGLCRAYPEVVDCVGMGTSPSDELYVPCVYRFRRPADGAFILVRSVGEYMPEIKQDVSFHAMGFLTEADAQTIRNLEEASRREASGR